MAKPIVCGGLVAAVVIRLALLLLGAQPHLSRRVEVVTPITSPMRLAEGYWLKNLGLSPYAGSAFHGSPLLLGLLGPLANKGTGQSSLEFLRSFLVFVAADLIGAFLLYSIGAVVEAAHERYVAVLQVDLRSTLQATEMATDTTINPIGKEEHRSPGKLGLGEVAALLYLLNPFTIAVCVGGTTTPFENMLVIMSLYGAVAGNIPLAAFGWAISTHLSLYPAVLIIPISLLIKDGPDRPQRKVFDATKFRKNPLMDEEPSTLKTDNRVGDTTVSRSFHLRVGQSWLTVTEFLFWSALWWFCIIMLCSLALGGRAHLLEMLTETYGFILTVEDLAPNLGLFWYFFTEVFTHFRFFFIMVFHANIIFMILPVTIRLHHRPFFLAFIMVAISTLLKSYPSVGDAALTLALMSLCTPALSGFRFSFLILYGYLFVACLSPSMYNLWIWRGTGNANFYFAMALVYAAFQSILIVESVGTVIRFDRGLKIAEEKGTRLVNETVKNEIVG